MDSDEIVEVLFGFRKTDEFSEQLFAAGGVGVRWAGDAGGKTNPSGRVLFAALPGLRFLGLLDRAPALFAPCRKAVCVCRGSLATPLACNAPRTDHPG